LAGLDRLSRRRKEHTHLLDRPAYRRDRRNLPGGDVIRGRGEDAEVVAAIEALRPDLHRYCARMTGSVIDGEDVVQDVLVRALDERTTLRDPSALRAWLFRVAHNRALDMIRRYDHRMGDPLDAAAHVANQELHPDEALARAEAVRTAASRFVELPATQRSCVILKDVLDHSLGEIAALLELSVPAVKAALHRGRVRLRELTARPSTPASRPASPVAARYAELFNARDWDGVRALLVADVRVDLVGTARLVGREASGYFSRYDALSGWRFVPGWLRGREVLAVWTGDHLDSLVELTVHDGRISVVRDFRHVPYIGRDAAADFEAA
jgi:RNA polymerase sigma factor (sigma-70 family)